MTPEQAPEVVALVDTLIPGDDRFPPASLVGTHGHLVTRLRELHGPEALAQALQKLGEAAGALATRDPSERNTAVGRFEQADPALFQMLRMITYLSYYEQPAVIDVLRGMGFDYNDAPLPDGYRLEPFDPATDRPRTARGSFVSTADLDGRAP
ncbi:MAG: hypothetical protein ACFB6S_00290 [Geminicoccaceae bacterium]